MYCKRLGRLVSGLYRCRTGLCRAAVRGQRSAGQQRSAAVWSPCPTASCNFSTRSSSGKTVDPDEVRRFQSLAGKWWDEQGEFAALHAMNDLRVPFIRDNLLNVHTARHPGKPLAGLRILDVGCGGGLLTEACTLEELSADGEEEQGAGQFDAVVASEVVEHLADLETFAFCSSHVLKPGGSLFITTINKTNLSYALGIVVAEQLLRIVPSGTHDWEKFISPVDLERLLASNGFSVQSVLGMLYNPVSGAWSWTNSTAINYALHAVKLSDDPQPDRAEDSGPHPEQHSAATHS